MADEQSPLTLAETAIALHELYLSFVNAGFDEDQALYLIAEVLSQPSGIDVDDYEY